MKNLFSLLRGKVRPTRPLSPMKHAGQKHVGTLSTGAVNDMPRSDAREEGFRFGPVGLASYQRSFGLRFVEEAPSLAEADYDSRVRVLMSDHRYGMRWDLSGKKVAVVGNGPVLNCGRLIDSCDEVIRISTMRNWQKSPVHDGTRVTTWSGHPWLVVHRNNRGELEANDRFAELLENGARLWASSPFHISLDAYWWLSHRGLLDRLLVVPPPANIYEIACSHMEAEDLRKLFSISAQINNIVGLPHFDLLLTGTRMIFLIELCGAKDIAIFGTNLFNFSPDGVWFGHDLQFDYEVLMAVKQRILAKGGTFYWNEEQQVQQKWRSIR
ncbi:hypothetical protein [Nitratireductor luteus]|uniref:hypothetical protein n=1 Tax=Nitratireductor luteus TaxID=2976980 RepID=UPI00223F4157|nr:hypothetical protein [Nitratireductor luteus]